jgi:hypothetical protein
MDGVQAGAAAAWHKLQLRGAVILKPTENWKPKNCRDPNNCQNNSKRDKAHWPMCGEFPTPSFAV